MSTEPRSCRLCDENNEQMYNIFDVKTIRLIQDCLPILIYEDDPLSKYICGSCNENLNMFADFKKTCIDIARKHRSDLENSTGDAVEKYLNKIKEFEDIEETSDSRNGLFADTSVTDMEIDSMDETSQTSHTTQTSQSQNGDIDGKCILEDSSMFQNKPRITGPKSKTNSYIKVIKTEEIMHQPLALKELVVQSINVQNISEFDVSFSHEDVAANESMLYCCRYCDETFEEEDKLALHELEVHIQLHLVRVDAGGTWNASQDGYNIRNQWMMGENKAVEEDEALSVGHEELLIPISEEKAETDDSADSGNVSSAARGEEVPTLDVSRDGPVYFVGDVAYARGIPLADIAKEERNSYYQSVLYIGAKRKFCQLCRYLFRDNWSMDIHYLQSSCHFSCHYCGEKFKRNRYEMPAHLAAHEAAGHEKCMNVFTIDKWGKLKETNTSCLSVYQPPLAWMYQRSKPFTHTPPPKKDTKAAPSPTQKETKAAPPAQKEVKSPCPKLAPSGPTPMKLRVRTSLPTPPIYDDDYEHKPVFIAPKPKAVPVVTIKKEVNGNGGDAKNQAYFCKKCYQVFTKLGNYNIHMSKCTREGAVVPSAVDKAKPAVNYRRTTGSIPGGDAPRKMMPALTPLPIPLSKIKQEVIKPAPPAPPVIDFPCNYCSSVFKTIYSRNSHMRIHVRNKASPQVQAASKRPAQQQAAPPAKRVRTSNSFEPIVEIHEGATTTIGSVSITPLRKTTVSGVRPEVLKLVENNPNISFKPRGPVPIAPKPMPVAQPAPPLVSNETPPPPQPLPEDGDVKGGYKCASCLQYFANKSNLYFHKKNQCTGSRYPCPFCKKRFGTASEYSSHIFYSHPE